MTAITAARRLKSLLAPGHCLMAPGAYDGLSARIAAQVGFDAVYMTGVNSAYARLEKLRHVWLAAMTGLTGGVECANGSEWATWFRENKRREWPPSRPR